jgi:hypothetical protein
MNLDRPTRRDKLVMRLILFVLIALWATAAVVVVAACS